MRSDLTRRVKALESRLQVDQANDEAEAMRLFLAKLTDEELDRLGQIVQRTENLDEFTPEERAFWDDLVARYGEDHEPD